MMQAGVTGSDDCDLGPDFNQIISLNGKEYAHTIHGFEVKIHSSNLSAIQEVDSGSSKVKISTITNQNWELPTHHGRIVASNNKYLSYVLEGRNGFVLRLIHQETNNRALLKGFVGAIVDVAFYHANSNLLACVDEGGNLYVWDLDKSEENASDIQMRSLKIKVQHSHVPDELEHRLIWSPHVSSSEEDEEEQEICNIVLTHGNDIEVLDINEIFSTYSSGSSVPKLCCGCYSIHAAHEKSIHDLSLSPDGSVLATVSEDGHLKFWQVNWEKDKAEEPKCLHDFIPHNGDPVTRLIFCDNHISQDPHNQYWRFLITAAKNNTEIKIWCAVNWKCLQTVRVLPPENIGTEMEPHVILNLDLSASYLIVTDSNRKALLILQLFTSAPLGDASVTSVTEYLLTQPVLSFTVSRCVPLPLHAENDEYSGEESEEEDKELATNGKDKKRAFDSRRNTVLIELHCVHTRSMQSLLVRFEPSDVYGVPPNKEVVPSKVPQDNTVSELLLDVATVPDHPKLSSLPSDLLATSQISSPTTFQSLPSLKFNASPKLLTPSEFTSPLKSETVPDSTVHPLLSPASIVAAATTDKLASKEIFPTLPNLDTENTLSDTQATLTSVSSELADPDPSAEAVPPVDAISLIDTVPPAENPPGNESIHIVDNIVVEADRSKTDNDVLDTATEDNELPSAEDKKQAFDSIMELLSVPKPVADSSDAVDGNQASFEEFTDLLCNPERLQQQEEEIKSSDRFHVSDEATQSEGENVQVVSSSPVNSVKSYPDVLKSTACQDPNLSQNEEKNYGKLEAEGEGEAEAKWPDIGASTEVPGKDKSDKCDFSEAGIVESVLSSEQYQSDNQLSDEKLLMPSAIAEVQDLDVQGSNLNTDISNSTPDLLDETSSGVRQPLELEEGAVKAKPKSRKRSKRSKGKQNTGPVGVAGVFEVPSDSPELKSAVAIDLLPSAESDQNGVPAATAPVSTSEISQHFIELLSNQQEILTEFKNQQQQNFEALQNQMSMLKASVVEQQKTEFAEMKIELQQKLDRAMKDRQSLDKQKQDKLITTLSSTLTTAVNAKLDKLIKMEMKNSVLPAVHQSVTSLHERLSKSSAELWSAEIKSGIGQLVSSKELPEAVGVAMITSLQKTLPSVCEEVFRNIVLASFERSCQEMFRQVDEAFRRGTMEYLSQLQQQHDPTLQYLVSSVDSLQSAIRKSLESTHLQAIVHQEITSFSEQMKEMVVETVSDAMHKEVGSILEMQATRFSQHELSYRADKKEEVQKLVQTQNYNSAFELALSTTDLQLVTYLCQQVDPDVVFEKSPCPLTQPVLLSLIQQLSVNLQENLALKLKYLDQSLLALDIQNEVTKNHMCPVIKDLSEQVATILEGIQADPNFNNPGIVKQVKRLLMISQQMQLSVAH